MNTHTQITLTELHATIKLGIDAHVAIAGIPFFIPFDFTALWMLRLPVPGTHLDSLDCSFAFIPFRLPSVPLRSDCTQPAEGPGSEGVRRFALTEKGDLYAGGIARGNDQEFIHRVSGLTRIRYTGKEVFEPLAVRLKSNDLEIEFTQPLAVGSGWNPSGYYVTQWGYQGTQTYGGNKVRHRLAEVRSAIVSADRRRVFLEMPGLKLGEVVYVRLPDALPSASGEPLWSGEFWSTVNHIPKGNPGTVKSAPPGALANTTLFFSFSKGDEGR